jgi:hypothetical protein
MDLDSQRAIPLGARNVDEQDSSRARSTAPNRPIRIWSCKTDEGKVQYRPALLRPRATLAAAKLLPKSALSLHPELAHSAGLVLVPELELPYMRG